MEATGDYCSANFPVGRHIVCKLCGKEFSNGRRLGGHRAGKHFKRLGLKRINVSTGSLSDAQVGYLAAFLDGEGGIQITRNTRTDRDYPLALHPTVYLTNTNKEAIFTMKEWLNAGSVTCRKAREGCKDTYVLSITGTRNVERLLVCLRPHLIVKAVRADVMLEYCRSRMSHYLRGDRKFNETELKLYSALARLNRKGGRETNMPTHGSQQISAKLTASSH